MRVKTSASLGGKVLSRVIGTQEELELWRNLEGRVRTYAFHRRKSSSGMLDTGRKVRAFVLSKFRMRRASPSCGRVQAESKRVRPNVEGREGIWAFNGRNSEDLFVT